MYQHVQQRLCRYCRAFSTGITDVAGPSSSFKTSKPKSSLGQSEKYSPIKVVGEPEWNFKVKNSIQRRVQAKKKERSILFDQPVDWTSKAQKRERTRHKAFVQLWQSRRSQQSLKEQERWKADPWYRMQRTPKRQCIVTKLKYPNAFMVGFRKSLIPKKESEGDEGHKTIEPEAFIVPDRLLHPRVAVKKSIGLWTICNRKIVAGLSLAGPHSRFTTAARTQVAPDLAQLVYIQLVERVIQELEILRDRTRARLLRPQKRIEHPSFRFSGQLADVDSPEGLNPIFVRLTDKEAERVRAGTFGSRESIAFLDLGDSFVQAERRDEQARKAKRKGGAGISMNEEASSLPDKEAEASSQTIQAADEIAMEESVAASEGEDLEQVDSEGEGVLTGACVSNGTEVQTFESTLPSSSPGTGTELPRLSESKDANQSRGVQDWITSPPEFTERWVKTPRTDKIPLYTLTQLIPEEKQSELYTLAISLHRLERSHYLQEVRARKMSLGQDRTEIDIEEKSVVAPRSGLSSMVVLCTYPLSEGLYRRGDLGTDLGIALWRLASYLGQGWEEIDVDMKGREV